MDINLVLEFFYERASKRVKEKVEKSNLTFAQIYKPDHKQISRIINNRRNRNNRFLICDAVIQNDIENPETGKYETYGLKKKLGFKDEKEILWGTDTEINNYIFDLFKLLFTIVSDIDAPYNINRELFLCDYIPYAENSTYWNILFSSQNRYPAFAYGIREDTVIAEIDSARDNALIFLYQKCKNEFHSSFNRFADETKSFHKIDKVFKENFIEKIFIPMLKKYTPDSSSLGLRVRDLILLDLSHCASIVYRDTQTELAYKTKLINASSTYILALEKIQSEKFL